MERTNFMSVVSLALIGLVSGAGFCGADDSPRLVLKGHTKPVVDIQFAADGKTVASMSADGETILWDLSAESGRRVPSLSRSLIAGTYLQFTKESPELLLAGSGGHGLLIDSTTGETITEYGDRKWLNYGSIVYLGGRRALVGNTLVQEVGKAGNLLEVPNMTSSVAEAVSPDGNFWVTNRRVLSASEGKNRLEIIDLATGRVSAELPKFANYIVGVSWIDNQHVLVLHAFGALTLWETGPKLRLVAKQEISGTALATSSTGKVAAVTLDNYKAVIFDITNDAISLRQTVTAQSPIQLSGDGGRLLSAGTAYGSYIVTDTSTGSVVLVVKQLESDLFPEMTSDGQEIVIGHADGTITFQSIRQSDANRLNLVADLPLQLPSQLPPHPLTPPGFLNYYLDPNRFKDGEGEIVFSPQGDACVTLVREDKTGEYGLTIAELKPESTHFPVWQTEEFNQDSKVDQRPVKSRIASWAFTPDSQLFVDLQQFYPDSYRVKGVREFWFVSGLVEFGSGYLSTNSKNGPRPLAILGLAINPDQKSIVALAGEYDRKVRGAEITSADFVVLEYPSGKLVKTLAKNVAGTDTLVRFAFSPSGDRVAVLINWKIHVWDIQSGKELPLVEDLKNSQFWLIDEGRTLVVVARGKVRGIDLESNAEAFVWNAQDKQSEKLSAIEFSHDGKYALCGSTTGEVNLRESHTGAVLLRHAAFDGAVAAVGISRDGTQIAAANADRTLRIWKLGTIANPESMATNLIEVDSGE